MYKIIANATLCNLFKASAIISNTRIAPVEMAAFFGHFHLVSKKI